MEPQLLSAQSHRFATLPPWKHTKQTTFLSRWRQYVAGTRSYTATRFIFEMILLAWFLKIVVTLPVSLTVLLFYGDPSVWQNPQQAAFAARPVANAILALGVAPLLETIIGQWAPIFMIRQLTPREWPALAVTTLLFAGLHFMSWGAMIFVATIPVGFVLAWSFLVWQRRSLAHAISVTTAIHACHNAIALFLMAW